MGYSELDEEEEEYDLICKFEDYYMKHVENKEKKKKEKEKQEKQTIKHKKKFARSNFISTINSAAYNKNNTPILNYY